MRMDYGEHPAVLLASLMVGFILAAVLIVGVAGGGFVMALLILALLPVATGALTIAGRLEKTVGAEAATEAAPRPVFAVSVETPHRVAAAERWAVAVGAAAAMALAVFSLGTMTWVHGVSHTLEDIRADFFFYSAVLLGFGVLASLLAMPRGKGTPVWRSSAIAITGTGLGTLALMNCCVGALAAAWPNPALTSLTIELMTYKAPLILAGVTANALGVIPLARTVGLPLTVQIGK